MQPEYSNEMELDCENPKVRVHDNSSITEIFGLFFSNEVLQDILKYTNLAFRNKRQKERISERDKKWYDLSEDELLKYISIIIFMGIAKLSDYSLHWSTKTHFQSNLKKLTYLKFRFNLAESLSGYISRTQDQLNNEESIQMEHALCKSDIIKRCKICYKNGKNSKTCYYCSKCEIYLHEKCFKIHLD